MNRYYIYYYTIEDDGSLKYCDTPMMLYADDEEAARRSFIRIYDYIIDTVIERFY